MTGNQRPSDISKQLAKRLDIDLALQAAGLGLWEVDLSTNQVIWDQRCRELFGIDSNQIPFPDTLSHIHPEDVERVNQAVKWALDPQSDGSYQATYRTVGEYGHTRWIQSTGRRYVDQAGQPVRFAGVAQDITSQVEDRQQAQQSLKASQDRLQSVIDLAGLGSFSIDVATNGLTKSSRVARWYGLPERTDVDTSFNVVHEEDRDSVRQVLADAIKLGTEDISETEYRIVQAQTGHQRILRTTFQVIRDEEGQPVRVDGTVMDITAQRAVQLELEQQVQQRTEELAAANEELAATNEELATNNEEYAAINEELEEANSLLNRSNDNLQQFAYVASHDLQEPLRKIQSFGDILKTRFADQLGDGTDYLNRMQAAASRMSTLIRDLLAYSRISSQRNGDDLVSLSEVVDKVLTDLELIIEETGATIEVGVLPSLPGDVSQLGQLFQNLITNAIKFRRPGTAPVIQISANLVEANRLPPPVKPSRRVAVYHCIEVADNGIGFDEKYLDRIFQVFQRLHSRSEITGTGIGLAICEKVVTGHGGAITATSQIGQGATFSMYLPA